MEKGTIINNTYQIMDILGTGGLGEIYLGYHINLQKYVVVKKVKGYCSGLINNRIEVDILKSLHHTYLPQVYDFIENEDGIFTVMEYISGHDLKYYMDQGYQFDEEQLIFWLKQLCQVLDYLHSRRPAIIHCDIKPANIMITDEGNVCLIDFNISLDGENNKDLVGLTSAYASPEQVERAEYKMRYGSGERIPMDGRTDIYSIGAVFYYLMTGIRPDIKQEMICPLKEMSLSYSSALCNILDKAMSMDQNRRFRTAGKMVEAIEHKEKWETENLRRWKLGILSGAVLLSLSLIITSGVVVYHSYKNTQSYRQDYENYIGLVGKWNQDLSDEECAREIIDTGMELLNKTAYKGMYEQEPEHKAEILYRVGQSLLELEDYDQSEEYLEEALKYEKDRGEIYRDLAIVQARQGYLNSAKESVRQAEEQGIDYSDSILLYAELAMAEDNYAEVWKYAVSVIQGADKDVAVRAAAYLIDASKYLDNTEELLDIFKIMESQASGAEKYIWIRKCGELYYQMYQQGSQKSISLAEDCYELLYQNGYAQMNDCYNLAACYQESGKYDAEKRVLQMMEEEYPKEYKVPMRLAYMVYLQQLELNVQRRDYQSVQRYFEQACEICEKQGVNWQEDLNMIQLNEIINELKNQDWLR